MSIELKLMACLSTAHVAPDVAAEIDLLVASPPPLAARDNPRTWQANLVASEWQDYGWFIWVRSPHRAFFPPSLRACLDLAERSGAQWLQFDRDCPPLDELPTYDW